MILAVRNWSSKLSRSYSCQTWCDMSLQLTGKSGAVVLSSESFVVRFSSYSIPLLDLRSEFRRLDISFGLHLNICKILPELIIRDVADLTVLLSIFADDTLNKKISSGDTTTGAYSNLGSGSGVAVGVGVGFGESWTPTDPSSARSPIPMGERIWLLAIADLNVSKRGFISKK